MMAADIVDNASVLNDDMYQAYSDLRSRLRGQTIKISRYDAQDIADFNDFRKSQFGRFNISYEKGLPVFLSAYIGSPMQRPLRTRTTRRECVSRQSGTMT